MSCKQFHGRLVRIGLQDLGLPATLCVDEFRGPLRRICPQFPQPLAPLVVERAPMPTILRLVIVDMIHVVEEFRESSRSPLQFIS